MEPADPYLSPRLSMDVRILLNLFQDLTGAIFFSSSRCYVDSEAIMVSLSGLEVLSAQSLDVG